MFESVRKHVRLQWFLWFQLTDSKMRALIRELHQELRQRQGNGGVYSPTPDERHMIDDIRRETSEHNLNNIMRTHAYLTYFNEFREVHWALLAHVVSRNGGWGMTDLCGEWFQRVAKPDHPSQFFSFLERANWLIFGDAYPQLLLYKYSRRDKKDYSYLLPTLGVSRFMVPVWRGFFRDRDSNLLTKALIVNEQNFIEQRVVQNREYSDAVLASAQYQVQSLLDLNHIVIPYERMGQVRLAGTAVQHFVSLPNRISTGKRLYRMLFQDAVVHRAIVGWMKAVKHTASRSDYWPEFFTPEPSTLDMNGPYRRRFGQGRLPNPKLYSPQLLDVWPNVQHAPVEQGDWFERMTDATDLLDDASAQALDFTEDYVKGLRTTEDIIGVKQTADELLGNRYT